MTAEVLQKNSMILDTLKPNGLRPRPYKFVFNPVVAIMTAVILVLTVALGVVVVTSGSEAKCKDQAVNVTEEDKRTSIPVIKGAVNIGGGGKHLRIVPRNDWQAEPASRPLDKLQLPVHRIIISHTATEGCVSLTTCASLTKSIQNFYKHSRQYAEIPYNFLIGGDGCVYEGRGWDDQGAHTRGYNADSIGIAFIGTFSQEAPPKKQLDVAKLLIDEGVRLKKIVPDYRLYGARQLAPIEGPGEALFAIIKTWPNWSHDV